MPRFNVRMLFIALCILCLAFVLTWNTTNSVQAAGPDSGYRIIHTADWYRARSTEGALLTGPLHYYGGKVMLTSTAYAIYWAPSGHSISSSYQNLIGRYFTDIGGSKFYGIVKQYYQNPGAKHIQNSVTFGGQWVDSSNAYPRAGTGADPLQDADIQAEVVRAMAANGWTGGYGHQFFVFTAPGIESCIVSNACTPGTPHPAYCAYHGFFKNNHTKIIYANMPYDETWTTQCRTFGVSPNGNIAADSEISIISHEHFEAVTDANPPPGGPNPPVTAWVNTQGYEIGDLCAYKYGGVAGNGSNITLNGNPYIMQLEWSNRANGCAKK